MSERPERETWWHRFRFSLRSLMIAIGILCGGLGWIINRAHVQRDAVAAIERAGGKVMYDREWIWKRNRPVPTGKSRWPNWLVVRTGIDYLSNVTYVNLRYRGSDEILARIGRLHRLEYLSLGRIARHRRPADAPDGLDRSPVVVVEDTQISDAGLVHLKNLKKLQTLSIGLTRVSDEGLPHLKMLTGLKGLSLYLTEVSDDAGGTPAGDAGHAHRGNGVARSQSGAGHRDPRKGHEGENRPIACSLERNRGVRPARAAGHSPAASGHHLKAGRC